MEYPKEQNKEQIGEESFENIWILRYREYVRFKPIEETEHEIISFNRPEDLQRIQRCLKPPSALKLSSDYLLFRKDIKPLWEDEANKQCGQWVITLQKVYKEDLDRLWQIVLVGLIHGSFDCGNEICGAFVNIRGKCNKICIWTADGNKEDAVLAIGRKLKQVLELGSQRIEYQLLTDVMAKKGKIKSIYTM